MGRHRVWILNLDADDELGNPSASTSVATRKRIADLSRRIPNLVPEGDRILGDEDAAGAAAGLLGRAWCPTPRALARLTVAGALVPESPAFEVLRRVNHRAFSANLGATLPGAQFVW